MQQHKDKTASRNHKYKLKYDDLIKINIHENKIEKKEVTTIVI